MLPESFAGIWSFDRDRIRLAFEAELTAQQAKKAGIVYIDEILDDIKKMFKNVTPIRNSIAHRGVTSDIDILLVELYQEVQSFINKSN